MSNVKYKYMHTTMDIAWNKMADNIDEWCEIEIHAHNYGYCLKVDSNCISTTQMTYDVLGANAMVLNALELLQIKHVAKRNN